ncbi:hypothetical protein P7C70_g2093, partial [Phenoliferia sp. Uapishka_3]
MPDDAQRSLDLIIQLLPLLSSLLEQSQNLRDNLIPSYNHNCKAQTFVEHLAPFNGGVDKTEILERLAKGFTFDCLVSVSQGVVDAVGKISRHLVSWSKEAGGDRPRVGSFDVSSGVGSWREPEGSTRVSQSFDRKPHIDMARVKNLPTPFTPPSMSTFSLAPPRNDAHAVASFNNTLIRSAHPPPSPISPRKPEFPDLHPPASQGAPNIFTQQDQHRPPPFVANSRAVVIPLPAKPAVPIIRYSIVVSGEDSTGWTQSQPCWLVWKTRPLVGSCLDSIVISSDAGGSLVQFVCAGDEWVMEELFVSELPTTLVLLELLIGRPPCGRKRKTPFVPSSSNYTHSALLPKKGQSYVWL